MHKINKAKLITLIVALLLVFTNRTFAQGEEKKFLPGYVFKTTSNCPGVTTSANPTSVADIHQFNAKDDTDVRLHSPGCLQQAEVHISIDKANPNFLIASTNTGMSATNNFDQGYYFTDNLGIWQSLPISDHYPTFPFPSLTTQAVVDGDPSTAFNASGNAFISTLEAVNGSNRPGFYALNSTQDNASTPWTNSTPPIWTPGAVVPPTVPSPFYTEETSNVNNAFDREMIAVDNFINSPNINNMYAVGTEFTGGDCVAGVTSNIVFLSTNCASNISGNPFSVTTPDLRFGASGWGHGAQVQTGRNGEVFVCWVDYPTSPGVLLQSQNIGFAYSENNSSPINWDIQTTAALNPVDYTGGVTQICSQGTQADFANANIVFGVPATTDALGNRNDGTGYIRMNDAPSMAVDKSCGRHSGRVYIAFPEQSGTPGYGTSVIAVSFLDRGSSAPFYSGSWSTPIIVSLPGNNVGHSFFPAITVDDLTGFVSVAYYCMDGLDASHTNSTNTYLAFSSDGASTFVNIKVSDVPHLTAPIPGYDTYSGDYIGIAAHGGKTFAAWSDNRINSPLSSSYNSADPSLWQIYVSEIDFTNSIGGPVTTAVTTPNILPVAPTTIGAGIIKDFQAVQEVIVPVPSGSSFNTISTSTVDIHACGEVNLTDGFSAQNELHVFIGCFKCTEGANSAGREGVSASNTRNGDVSSEPLKPVFNETQLGTDIKVGIFPNPTTGLVYVNLSAQNQGNVTVTITDVDGRIVTNNNYRAAVGANNFKLDLSNVQNGVYAIRVTDDANNIIKRDKIILTK
jgi:hypothetical protein